MTSLVIDGNFFARWGVETMAQRAFKDGLPSMML